MVRISDLRLRDVINVIDGRRLGSIKDIDLDLEDGKVKTLILPGNGRFMGLFGKNDDLEIPWEKITKIGVDVILVELNSFTDPKHSA
ncbi:MAG: YlmC/YmxH family sporulation protein [Bacillota bacterium]